MAAGVEEFQSWLSKTLTDLNTDESIFGTYITGILESDETCDEKAEALQDLLTEIVQNASDLNRIRDEIIQKWNSYTKVKEPPPKDLSEDVGVKLSKMIESHSLSRTNKKEHTEEEKKIRQAILSQYSQMTDDEEEDNKESGQGQGSGEPKDNLEKNTNAQTVANAEKLKREQARLDSQKKKEKDKEDREKQKQLKEDKKEKRKTQKGERRR